jgi:hypothetical protein
MLDASVNVLPSRRANVNGAPATGDAAAADGATEGATEGAIDGAIDGAALAAMGEGLGC